MTDQTSENTCSHIACGCEAEPGSKYCSPECEKAREGTDCSCGHAECQARA
jgi:hypothetical protein